MAIEIGHNSVDPTLKSFVDRIEKLEDEKSLASEDIKSVYAEAKGKDIDVRALRAVIKLRREDAEKRRAREDAIDALLLKLGMI